MPLVPTTLKEHLCVADSLCNYQSRKSVRNIATKIPTSGQKQISNSFTIQRTQVNYACSRMQRQHPICMVNGSTCPPLLFHCTYSEPHIVLISRGGVVSAELPLAPSTYVAATANCHRAEANPVETKQGRMWNLEAVYFSCLSAGAQREFPVVLNYFL